MNLVPLNILGQLSLFELLSQRTIHPAKPHRHHSLEVLQIEGFAGTTTEVELAQYVLENAVSLKKIVIDIRRPFSSRQTGPVETLRRAMAAGQEADVIMAMAREGVSLLKAKLPAGVELIML